jgi:ribosomal protein S12 methylthiotransferase accessory factor
MAETAAGVVPDQVFVVGSEPLSAAIANCVQGRGLPDVRDPRAIEEMNRHGAIVVTVDTRCYCRNDGYRYQWPVWLPVHVDGGWITIGPLVRQGVPGCPLCVARRQRRNRADAAAHQALHQGDPGTSTTTVIAPPTVAAVAALVEADLSALRSGHSARTERSILRISTMDIRIRGHRLLPDPDCPRCTALPADSRSSTNFAARPLPKSDANTFRLRRPDLTALRLCYTDAEVGVIESVASGPVAGVPTAVARLAPARLSHDSQHGYGQGDDYRTAELVAVLEALERRASTRPRGRRTIVSASYTELGTDALDPRRLGMHPEESYRQPDFPFVPFDPAARTGWVWGYSFGRSGPVLVPESTAYYGKTRRASDRGWFYECSSGCALGSSLTEAVFHGLLEVAERDAFLIRWYGRISASRVDLASFRDLKTRMAAELIRQRQGYDVSIHSIMVEQRIPVLLALARDRLRGVSRPRLACATAAHPDPATAALKALREVSAAIEGLRRRYAPTVAAAMVKDPMLVREMDDHSMLYGHPDAEARLEFLDGDTVTGAQEIAEKAAWPRHDDLTDDLTELVGRYLADGLDVIAVETTSAELDAAGLASAKVVVPGTVPMTFGHRFRRTAGLPRLATVAGLLGYAPADSINPYPHPFP